MRAKQISLWTLILGLVSMAFAVLPASMPVLASPQTFQDGSGIQLTASIAPTCTGASWFGPECRRPYAGEFVVTALNGEEVTRVMTNYQGQATVDLPPGRYIVGVRTEELYPRAAPVIVNVLANRYASVLFSLDSGLRWQLQSNR